MRHPFIIRILASLLMLNPGACSEMATVPEQAGIGPHPTLPPPNPTLIPTVNIAPAKGWTARIIGVRVLALRQVGQFLL